MQSVELLPVLDAIEQETGRRPSPPTAYRWMTRGAKGVRLVCQMLGGRRYTTRQAVRDFIDNVTAASVAKTQMTKIPRSEDNATQAIAEAEAELAKLGV